MESRLVQEETTAHGLGFAHAVKEVEPSVRRLGILIQRLEHPRHKSREAIVSGAVRGKQKALID
jgi:hypothetical protein